MRKFVAWKILKNKNIKVVLVKKGIISGELRKSTLKHLAGEKRTDTMHNENGCRFYLDVAETYFSPRLSNERRIVCSEIAKKLKDKQPSKGDSGEPRVLVMFAGVAPFPVVLGRMLKLEKKNCKIVSSELNKLASEYAEKNVRLNKLEDYVKVVEGDSRKLREGKFDYIVMARPNLEETFLESALKYSKKGTKIYYYGFGTEEKVLEEIKKDTGAKIGKVKIRKAGDIAPGKWRWLAEFIVK
jgi:tRNA (guanine37-N1)-methyltransferase